MKKILLVIAAITVLISCNKAGENEYIVTGTIKGIADGKSVTLEVQDETGALKPMDTVKIEKGKFTFKGNAKEPEMYLINIETVQGKIPFILENGDIEMNINKDSINITKVTGTYNNEELNSYKDKGIAIQKKMMKFQKDNTVKMTQAQQTKDTVVMNSLRKEYSKFQDEFVKQSDEYVGSHPKAFIAALIIEGMFNQMAPDVTKIKKFYDGLDKEVKDTKHGKKIKKQLDELLKPVVNVDKVEIGGVAPDFSAPNPQGKTVSLKENMGKVTVIDFWASWCKPCRAENPNMVTLYKEFHAKGLNIISVSLDEDGTKWKEAIAKDQLTWAQVSNLKNFEDPIANSYGIKLIPSTFVLDASGKVVAKDLRGAELKAKVAELLK
ncbi:redoxin domain-containing protein [Flavobacterium sp.]|uniref:redoxin domain-containing protein n=1 Tax=Flavobacterium sp. TaxID=239 RepID=UPI00286B912D|nr:redoxin domain-containing protein [Flavobacterium sp.]